MRGIEDHIQGPVIRDKWKVATQVFCEFIFTTTAFINVPDIHSKMILRDKKVVCMCTATMETNQVKWEPVIFHSSAQID